ncbi:MAG TPA: serine hydrolase domain-containing protein [Gemmatimonadales bacterium]|nr:serine hydrolase domain-containing protein [Gemmatimonadales bacterium]
MPREQYSYTNSGYALLTTLVERVSGTSFAEFTRRRIFEPAGMEDTGWRDDFTRLVPGRAQAYAPAEGGWRLAMPFESVVGPGGMLTTVGDWLAWSRALAAGTLGPGVTDSLTRRMRLSGGREIRYGLGLFVGEYRGIPEISHSGSTAGYSTFLVRYPDRGNLTIAVLCNAANAEPGEYARRLADHLVTDFPPPPPLDTVAVDSVTWARYAGVYREERTHAPLRVGADAWNRYRALPGGWLRLGNASLWRFEVPDGGRPTSLTVVRPDGDTVRYAYQGERPWAPAPEQLRAFVGRYYSEDLGVSYEAKLAGDTLTLSARPGIVLRLQPTYPDGFTTRGSAVWFTRDRRGRVSAMHVSESRVWDLVFSRIR